jgi:hypothetical protein
MSVAALDVPDVSTSAGDPAADNVAFQVNCQA